MEIGLWTVVTSCQRKRIYEEMRVQSSVLIPLLPTPTKSTGQKPLLEQRQPALLLLLRAVLFNKNVWNRRSWRFLHAPAPNILNYYDPIPPHF